MAGTCPLPGRDCHRPPQRVDRVPQHCPGQRGRPAREQGQVTGGKSVRRKRSDPRLVGRASSCGRPRTHFRSAESGPAARGSLTPGEGRPEAADPGGDSSRLPRAIWVATESREADGDVHKAGCPRPLREAARPGPRSPSYGRASCWVTDLRLAPLTCGPCAPGAPMQPSAFRGPCTSGSP